MAATASARGRTSDLAGAAVEFEGYEFVLQVAKDGDEVAQAADAGAVDRVDHSTPTGYRSPSTVCGEQRRGDDDELLMLRVGGIAAAGDEGAVDEAQRGYQLGP